jgi:hypothetical protein
VKLIIAAAAACSACRVVSPPPMMLMGAGTQPLPERTTTAMVLVAGEAELFGSEGLGLVVRVERQVSANVAAGGQLGFGKGNEGRKDSSHWLGEVRGYARAASTDGTWDWASILGSAGLTLMDTGLVAGTLALQGELSYPNSKFIPALAITVATSRPLRTGDPFGEKDELPAPTTWYGVGIGGLIPLSDSNAAIIVEAGLAMGDQGDNSAGPIHAAIGGAWYDAPEP